MNKLCILTVNINGLRHKLNTIINLINKYKTDFIFIQETKINDSSHTLNITSQLGIKHAIFSLGRYTGVATLQTSDAWDITHTRTDKEGRIVIIDIQSKDHKNTEKLTLVNIYAPSQRLSQPVFYHDLADTLNHKYKGKHLILGGGFQLCFKQIRLNTRDGRSTHQ
jgi:exonuclease III